MRATSPFGPFTRISARSTLMGKPLSSSWATKQTFCMPDRCRHRTVFS
ncbi:hypothetical protein LEMLEM_LOCUS21030 [Lemmus lemmus]